MEFSCANLAQLIIGKTWGIHNLLASGNWIPFLPEWYADN